MKYIIKPFSEIMIKSKPVRKRYLQMLQYNLNLKVKAISKNLKVSVFYDKLELNLIDPELKEVYDIPAIKTALSRTPGIETFLIVEGFTLPPMIQETEDHTEVFQFIFQKVSNFYLDKITDKSFVVRVKRSGNHNFKSTELERYLGGGLLKALDAQSIHGKINLRTPDITVKVEIKQENLYVIKNTFSGIGGFPTGAQEKVLSLLSGGFDSGVSTYSMMKRGCKVDFLFFNLGGSAHELGVKQVAIYLNKQFSSGYSANIITVPFEEVVKELVTNVHHKYRAIILKRCMLMVADLMAQEHEYYAIVKGDSLGQVSSQTLKNMFVIDKSCNTLVLRPLITENKQDIINVAQEIGTYNFAVNMPEYCGVISDKPATGASVEKVIKAEKDFDFDILTRAISEKKIERLIDIEKQNTDHDTTIDTINFPASGDIIIDVREELEYSEKPFTLESNQVINIPFFDINFDFPNLDQSKEYLFYCDKGIMSKLHALYLKEKGYNNIKVLEIIEKDKTCGSL